MPAGAPEHPRRAPRTPTSAVVLRLRIQVQVLELEASDDEGPLPSARLRRLRVQQPLCRTVASEAARGWRQDNGPPLSLLAVRGRAVASLQV